MNNIKTAIFFMGTGLTLGFTLIVYAHANFTTKETVARIESTQVLKDNLIINRLDRIESKIDNLRRQK